MFSKNVYKNAICRTPGNDFAQGLTNAELGAPILSVALEQHTKYVETLKQLGVTVDLLPSLLGAPDACFTEDTAIMTAEVAIITNPGAESRRKECDTIAVALSKYKPVKRMPSDPSATMDGGDVLLVNNTFYIGMSGRTNMAGLKAFESLLPEGKYKCVAVEVPGADGVLHLKSAVTQIGDNKVLVLEEIKDHPAFKEYQKVVVPAGEDYAANALYVNGTVIMAHGYNKTIKACQDSGCKVIALDMSEYRKMDGALTCLSLRF